jgi:hypothetical protein
MLVNAGPIAAPYADPFVCSLRAAVVLMARAVTAIFTRRISCKNRARWESLMRPLLPVKAERAMIDLERIIHTELRKPR